MDFSISNLLQINKTVIHKHSRLNGEWKLFIIYRQFIFKQGFPLSKSYKNWKMWKRATSQILKNLNIMNLFIRNLLKFIFKQGFPLSKSYKNWKMWKRATSQILKNLNIMNLFIRNLLKFVPPKLPRNSTSY